MFLINTQIKFTLEIKFYEFFFLGAYLDVKGRNPFHDFGGSKLKLCM